MKIIDESSINSIPENIIDGAITFLKYLLENEYISKGEKNLANISKSSKINSDIDENIKKNNSLKLVNEEELKEVKIDIEELKKLKEEAKQEIEDFEIKIKGLKVKKSERQDELDKRKSKEFD